MTSKQSVKIILIAFFVGALGSIVVERFLIPQISSITGWESLNRLVTNSPIVINRTTEVQLNEGVNMIELGKQVSGITVSIYDGEPSREMFRGLGIIMSSDGLIFTSKSVIRDNTEVIVVLSDGRKFRGLPRAADPKSDLAVLTIEASGLATANFVSSLDLKAGQRVLSLGITNRQFERELNSGLVTNSVMNNKYLDQWFHSEKLSDSFSTELGSRINYAGAPLVDFEGRLAAMMLGTSNEMIVAENLQTALASYLQTGKIIRPKLGLQYMQVSPLQASLRNFPRAGVVVLFTDRSSAASTAGLLQNDLIFEVNGQSLENTSFEQILNQSSPESTLRFKVLRAGKELEIIANLKPTQ